MSIQEFLTLVEESFSYLFAEFEFYVKYKKEIRLDHNSIGLESNSFRILFEQERGGFGIFVGGLDASFDSKGNGWVNLYSLMTYLTKKEIDWSILNSETNSEKPRIIFSVTAKEFAPLCGQVSEMFYSPDVVKQWKPAYDQYVKEKVRQRFGRK